MSVFTSGVLRFVKVNKIRSAVIGLMVRRIKTSKPNRVSMK